MFPCIFLHCRANINDFREVAPKFLDCLVDIIWKNDTDSVIRLLTYALIEQLLYLEPDLIEYRKDIFIKFTTELSKVMKFFRINLENFRL